MLRLNLGCGKFADPEWTNIDIAPLPGVDIVTDLNAMHPGALPFEDDSVDAFWMSHVIEHIQNVLPLMQELHRVAKPGAVCTLKCPHGGSDDAAEDPTHVRAMFPYSFGFYSQPFYWRADYGYQGDWLCQEIQLSIYDFRWGDTEVETWRRVWHERNTVQEMIATLVAVKPIRGTRKELQVPPKIILVRG